MNPEQIIATLMEGEFIEANALTGDAEQVRRALELRKTGLGASKVPTISGDNPWTSKSKLYLDMIAMEDVVNDVPLIAKVGSFMEPFILNQFFDRMEPEGVTPFTLGHTVFRETPPVGTVRHKKYPFLYATIDTIANTKWGVGGVEAKNVSLNVAKHWKGGECPAWNFVQTQMQMEVLGSWFDYEAFDHVYLVGLINNRDVEVRLIQRDPELCASLVKQCEDFWNVVTSGSVADALFEDIDGRDVTGKALRRAFPGDPLLDPKELSSDLDDIILQYENAKEQLDYWKKLVNEKKHAIQARMENSVKGSTTMFNVTWPVVQRRVDFDLTRFKRENQHLQSLVAQYQETIKSYRGGLKVSRREN